MEPEDNSLDQPYAGSQYDSSLDGGAAPQLVPTSSYTRAGAPEPQPKRRLLNFNRSAALFTGGIVLVILVVIVGILLLSGVGKTKHDDSTTNKASKYAVSDLSVGDLKSGTEQLAIGQADHLAVNGQLRVNNTLVLAPSTKPTTPTTGQIYYDKTSNQPYYFNGSSFVSLAPVALPQHLTSLGGAAGAITLGNGLQISGNQLTVASSLLQSVAALSANQTAAVDLTPVNTRLDDLSTRGDSALNAPRVSSLQGLTGAVNLVAGTGIAISGTTISSTGVTDLTTSTAGVNIQRNANGSYSIDITGVGSQPILLGPSAAQTDNSSYTVLHVSKTGSGGFIDLSSSGGSFVVDRTGTITNGQIGYSQVQGAPATTVTSIAGASGAIGLGTGLSLSGSTLSNSGVVSITGTTNQINVTTGSGGAVTLSLPQDISTTASPSFVGLTASGTVTANAVTVQGGNMTLGTAGSRDGLLRLANANSVTNAVVLKGLNPSGTGDATIQIPTIAGGTTDQVCLLSLANCAGAGNGVTATSGSAGYIPVFSSGQNITNSILFQQSNHIGINTATPGSFALNVQGGDVNFAGAATVGSGLNVTGTATLGDVSIAGTHTLTVGTGATSLGGSLGVSGAVTLSNGLVVTGTTSLNGNTSVTGSNTFTVGTGATNLGGTLAVSSTATLQSTLAVTGTTSLTGTLTANGGLTVTGNITQTGSGSLSTGTGPVSLNGNTSVTGSSTFATGTGAVSLNGSTTVTGTNAFSVNAGATNLGGSLGVTGASTFVGAVAIQSAGGLNLGVAGTTNGLLKFANASNSQYVNLQGLAPSGSGNATIQIPTIAGGTSDQVCLLTLANCAGAGGGVTSTTGSANYVARFTSASVLGIGALYDTGSAVGINTTTPGAYALNVQGGNVNFSGAASVGGNLDVAGTTSLAGNVSVTGSSSFTVGSGPVSLGGSLGVTGATTLGGTLSVNASSNFNAAVAVTGSNTLSVGGATTLSSTLSVSGPATFSGNLTQSGTGTFSTGTGVVSLNGNVSIAAGKSFMQNGSGTFDTASGAVNLNGVTNITGSNSFTVGTGATALGGTLGVAGKTTASGGADITGTTNINTTGTANTSIGNNTGTFSVNSNTTKITTGGAVSGISTISASGAVSAATSGNTINGLVVNAGSLSAVTGIASNGGYAQTGSTSNTFSGATNFTASGTALSVTNNVSIGGTAAIGTLTVGSGGISSSGTLTVSSSSASSIAGTLNLTGTGTGLAVTNSATIGGDLAVRGSNGLTVGVAGSVTGSLNFANSTNSNLATLQAAAPSGTGTASYILPSLAGGTSDQVCLQSLNNCGGSPNTVIASSTGTANTLAKFSGGNAIANSSITDDGTTVTVNSNLTALNISTSLIQSSAAMSITPGGDLTIGATNHILALQGNGSSSFTVSANGFTSHFGFTAPTANRTINLPDESGTICIQNSNNCGFALAASGVTQLNGLAGNLSVANATASGSTITINNASTTQKGIAQFNASDFVASAGVIDTVQGITTTSSVQFGSLALGTGDLSLSATGKVNTNIIKNVGSNDITIDATNNAIIFKTANGTNSFMFPTYGGLGQVICTSGVTCAAGGGQALILEPSSRQDANANRNAVYINKASGTGNLMQLQAGGTDALVIDNLGNTSIYGSTTISSLNVPGTLTANTITPSSSLTVGATTQSFTLQGTGSSLISAAGGGYTTSIGFNIGSGGTAPTGNVVYQFQNDNSVAPGTYNVCTTAGNCAGVGGSVTSTGGTPGKLAKFTSSGNIADSLISESGSTISIGGNLTVGTSGSSKLTLGIASTADGSLVFNNATNAYNTTLQEAGTLSASNTIKLPSGSGTIAVSATGPIQLDPLTGQISCASCLTGGGGAGSGVSSFNSLTGNISLANASGSGSTITIDDASTSTKGIAQFNATNFTASSGVINTIQDITTGASVTFGNLVLQGMNGLTIGSSSNIGQLAFKDGTADGYKAAFSPATLTANRTITIPNAGGTLAVSASGNLSLSALGDLSITNSPNFTGSVTTPSILSSGSLSITPSGQLTLGSASRQLTLLGNGSTTFSATASGNTTTVGFVSPTGNRTISFPDATGTVCLQSSASCGFASSSAVVSSLNSLTGALSVANATASGSTVTINDASTSQKGIAQFNSTNFSASSGVINTIQDIASSAAPSFSGLTIGSGGATVNGAVTLNGNTIVSGTNTLQVGTGAATFGGTVGISGLTTLGGGITVTGTAAINTTGTANTAIGNSTGTFSVTSSGLNIATSGAVSGATTIAASGAISAATSGNTINGIVVNSGAISSVTGYAQASGNFAVSGTGSFDTASGAVNLNGNTTITGSKTLTVGSGATTLGGTLTVTGAGSFSSTLAVGSSSQFQVTSSGNVTSGTINGQTISSSANFTGTVNIQGTAGLTLGVPGVSSSNLTFANSSSMRTVSLQGLNPSGTGNAVVQIPSIAGGSTDTVCLVTLGNCAGSGGGTTGSGSQNYVTKFDTAGGAHIGNSQIYDDGTFVGINTSTNNAKLSVVTSGTQTSLYLQGAATGTAPVSLIKSGGSTGDLLQLQNSSGTVIANIDSTGKLFATSFDTVSAGALSIGGTNATSIGLKQNTTVTGNFAAGSSSQFQVSGAGAVTAVGVNAGTGLIQGTGGLQISGTTTLTSLNTSGVVHTNSSGVLSTSAVVLGTETSGNYVSNLGTLTGLGVTGNTGAGSTPALSVLYGSSANTAAQGNTSLTFTGSGNLTGSVSGTAGGGFSTNTLALVNSPILSGTLTVQGATVSVGTAGSLAGGVVLANASNTHVTTLQAASAAGQDQTITIPASTATTDQVCLLTLANCVGAGGAVSTTAGTQYYLTKYNNVGASQITKSQLYDTGTFVGLNTTTNNGQLSIQASGTQSGLYVQGASSGTTPIAVLKNSGSTGDYLQLQNSAGTTVAKIDSSANLSIAGQYQINGTQISSANLSNDSNLAKLNATQTFTGNNTFSGSSTLSGANTFSGNSTFTGTTLFKNTTDSTAAVQIQNAAGTNVFNIDTTYNSNLLSNGGFEVNTTGWSALGSATVARNATAATVYDGVGAGTVTTTATAGDGAKLLYALAPSTGYALSFYVQLGASSIGNLNIGYSMDGSTNTSCLTTGFATSTGFYRIRCNFITGPTITGSPYVYITQSDATARTMYIDDVQLSAGSTDIPYGIGKVTVAGVISSPLTLQSSSNSGTAFTVQDNAGSTVLGVDTINKKVTIGSGGLTTAGNVTANLLIGNSQFTTLTGVTNAAVNSGYWYKRTTAGTAITAGDVVVMSGNNSGNVEVSDSTTLRDPRVYGVATQSVTSGATEDVAFNGNYTINVDSAAVNIGDQLVVSATSGKATADNNATTGIIGIALTAKAAGSAGTVSIKIAPISGQSTPNFRSDSTTAFQIQNAAGNSNLFVADTTNGVIGIGQVPNTGFRLSVNGAAVVTGTILVGGVEVNSSSVSNGGLTRSYIVGASAVALNDVVTLGSGGLLDTTTPRDTRVIGVVVYAAGAGGTAKVQIIGNALVNADNGAVAVGDQLVTSATSGAVTVDNNATTGILGYATTAKASGSSGTVGVRIQVTTGQSTPNFRSDSTTAFQIQNAAGSNNLFIADTTDTKIGIGVTPVTTTGTGILQIGATGATTADQGISFGGDTKANIYRQAANNLKTDALNFYLQTLVALTSVTSNGGLNSYNAQAGQVTVGTSGKVATIKFGSAQDTNLYRSAAGILQTAGGFNAEGGLGAGFNTYSTGTISQSNSSTSLVGSGTTFTAAMVGGTIYYADGSYDTIASYTDATHLTTTSTKAGTVTAQSYTIKYLPSFTVSATGATLHQNTTDSTTAFQIQNAAGTSNLLVANTTNSLIGIGVAPTVGGSALQVGIGGISTTGDVNATNITAAGSVNAGALFTTHYTANSNQSASDAYDQRTTVTSGTTNINDVVIASGVDGSNRLQTSTTTTLRDTRVYGVATGVGFGSTTVATAGRFLVSADTAAVAIGDQLVTSTTAGKVTVDNNATKGILGYATSAKAAGSAGTVGVRIDITAGQDTPNFRTDSTTAFQIQNAAGTSNLFVANTTNNVIGIGAAPTVGGATLQVSGRVSGSNAVNSSDFVTLSQANSLYAAGTGTNSYIANGTSTQTANFNIQSASSSQFAGILQAASGQSTGGVFQVLNAAGTAPFLYVGANNRVGFGTATPSAAVDIQSGGLNVLGGISTQSTAAIGTASGLANTDLFVTTGGSGTAAYKLAVLRGISGQTGNALEVQDSTGAALSMITASGALQGGNATGTNVAGTSLAINGGQGTGTGNGGNINFGIFAAGATGSTNNTTNSTVFSLSGADGSALFKNAGNSLTAFQVQRTTGSSVLAVNTQNSEVAINSGVAFAALSVTNAQSTDVTFAASQTGTGDILNLKYGSTKVVTVGTTGATLFQNSTDSTAAFQIQNAAGSNVINVDTSTTLNLITNGGFEANTTGYVARTGTTLARATSGPYDGLGYATLTNTATANAGVNYPYALASSTQYTLSFYAKSSAAMTTLVAGRADDGATETACTMNSNTVSTSAWTRYSCTFTTGTTSGSPYFYINQSDAVARTISIDDVQLQTGGNASAYGVGRISLNGVVNSPVSFQNATDSTTAFQVQSAAGATMFNVNTSSGDSSASGGFIARSNQNGQVFVGTSPTTPQIRFGSSAGPTISSSGGGGSGGINITATSAGSPALQVKSFGAAAGSAIFTAVNGSSATVASINSDGSSLFQNATDSTTAFAIQNAAGSNVINVDTSTTLNLITNGGFEVNTTGYTARTGTTLTRATSGQYDGAANGVLTNTATANAGINYAYALASSTQYTLSFYAMSSATANSVLVAGRADNGSTETDCSLSGTSLATGWQRYNCTFTTGTTSGSPYFYIKQSDATARTIYIDDVQLQTGSTFTSYGNGRLNFNGIITNPLTLQNNTDSTTALGVQNAAGTTAFGVDTLNSKINVGAGGISFGGNIGQFNSSNGSNAYQFYSQGAQIFNLNGYNSSLNSALRVSASQSSQSTTPVLAVAGYTGSGFASHTEDLFKVTSNTSATVLKMDYTGATVFKNGVDSAAGFQIQNTNGSSLFNANTTNLSVGIGSNATGQLAPWSTSANALPATRGAAATVVANGYVYEIGGYVAGSITGLNTVYYAKLNPDGSTGTWTTSANALPAGREGSSAVVANGYVYVIGGTTNGFTSAATVYYARLNADGSTGTWTTSANALPAARTYAQSVTANGYVYVLGGDAGFTAVNTIYYAKLNPDGSTGTWTTSATTMPAVWVGASFAVANGYIYQVANGDANVYYSKLNADGTINAWTTSANSLPAVRASGTAVVSSGYIYEIAGDNSSSNPTNTIYYAKLNVDGSTGTFATNANNLPAVRDTHTTVFYNGYIYAMGGNDGTNSGNTNVYYASTQRLQINGSLDLVSGSNGTLANADGAGGELTAGNTNIVGALQVQGNTNIAKSLNVLGQLTVSDQALFKNTTDSTSAFQIQNAAGTSNLFVADTTNSRVGIGMAPNTTDGVLQVKSSNTSYPAITATAASGGYGLYATASAGSSAAVYATNNSSYGVQAITGSGTAVFGSAQSGTAGKFAADQTLFVNSTAPVVSISRTQNLSTFSSSGDLLYLQDNPTGTDTGNLLNIVKGTNSTFVVNNSGAVLSQNATNSTAAFTLQNASGANVINVDTATTSNLITNGGFEVNINGYAGRSGTTGFRTTSNPYDGLGAAQVSNSATAGAGLNYPIALASSTTYTFSFYAKASASMTTLVAGRADNGSTETDCTLNPAITGSTPVSTAWAQYFCTFTTGTVSGSPYLYIKQSDATARTIYLDDLQLQTGVATTAYGSGRISLNGVVNSALSLQNTNDSTTAFQVQNASGSVKLLTVDTANNKVGVGLIPSSNGATFQSVANTNLYSAISAYNYFGDSIVGTSGGGVAGFAGIVGIGNSIATGVRGSSSGGLAGSFNADQVLTATTASPVLQVTRTQNLNGYNATGDLLYVQDNATGTGTTGGNLINAVKGSTSVFTVNNTGAVSAVGVNSTTGLLQSAGGLTVTGADANINVSSNFNTNINSGTSTGAINLGNSNSGALTLQSGASATTIGGSSQAGTITLGQSTVTNVINIGSAAIATSNTQTINIGTNASGTGRSLTNIGSQVDGSGVTVSAGTGGINLTPSGASNTGVLVKSASNSTAAFQIQNAGGANVLNVDTTVGKVTIQSGSALASTGSELANSTFSTTWTGSGWTLGSSSATHNTGNTNTLSPTTPITITAGSTYRLAFTVSGRTAGSILPQVGGVYVTSSYAINGSEVETITASGTGNLTFTPTTDFDGTVSAVSLKLITTTQSALSVADASGNVGLEIRMGNGTNRSTFVGLNSGQASTTINNSGFGANALQANISGASNSAFGANALQSNTTGSGSVALGVNTLQSNTTGSFNTSLGSLSLVSNVSGSYNSAVGLSAMSQNTTGTYNASLGNASLGTNTTGSYNSALGAGADVASGSLSYATAVGAGSTAGSSNTIALGRSAGQDSVVVGGSYASTNNAFSVSQQTYNSGTISQSGTTITGSASGFTSGMTGGTVYYADGTTATITYVSSNTLSSSVTKTVSGGSAYLIVYGGFNVATTGATKLQNSIDSTSAFQIQSAAGANVVGVDTVNKTLTVTSGNNNAAYGSELANNNFSTSWTGTGWTLGSSSATHNTGNTNNLSPTTAITITAGTVYRLVYTVSISAGASVTASVGGASGRTVTGNGTIVNFTDTLVATTNGNLTFTPSSNFNGTISAVSLKAVSTTKSALTVADSTGASAIEVRTSAASSQSIFIGLASGQNNISGTQNTALGVSALQSNTLGSSNTAMGAFALQNNTTGNNNTALGNAALFTNGIGYDNTAIGNGALLYNTSGYDNTAIGNSSMQNNTTGNYNIALGSNSLYYNTTGGLNIALGGNALFYNTSGTNNVSVGSNTLNGNGSGTNNTALGDGADVLISNLSFATAVGSNAYAGSSNTIVLGRAGTDSVAIGNSYSSGKLLSVGQQNYTAGTIAQSGTTITGSSTTFTTGMNGGTIYYGDGTSSTVTYVSATSLTSSVSKTVAAGSSYTLVWGGFNVASGGNLSVQTTTNSTAAFQIQNAAGTSNLFVADTTNSRVGIGATPATGLLTIGTNTTTNVGGIYFGTDTNLYRATAGFLATDGGFVTGGSAIIGNSLTGGYNAANAALKVGKDSGTNRSINAAGTIGASGADYAEYIPWSGAKPAQGSIVSYNGSNYVVSSTDTAAFIGNDNYDTNNSILVTFAGQVPVRVSGAAAAGDILVSNGDGTARAVAPSAATIAELLSKLAIAQESSSDTGVKLVKASIGTTSDSMASALQNQSASFANISVSGSANLTDLNVSGATTLTSLTVTGSATIQGSLTVTGLATVNDLQINGHIITAGGVPTAVAQTAAGAGANVSISGTDTTGTISITTGSAPSAGELSKILFSKGYGAAPRVVLSPSNDAAAGIRYFKGTTSTTDFMFNAKDTPAANTTYTFDYFIAQ